jgi:hypothetical protein
MNPTTDTLPAAGTTANASLYSRAEQILLPGLVMGIAGDLLLRAGPFGIGLFLWLALLAASALWLARSAGPARLHSIAIWSAAALCAASITVMRDLEALIPAMLLVIVACAVMTSLESSGITLRAARIRDYLVTGFTFPLQMLTFTPRLLKQANFSAITGNQRVPGVVRGIVLALPVLLVFGALFASADAGFSRYLSGLTTIVSPATLQHMLVVLILGWLATSLLGVACRKAFASTEESAPTAPLSIGPVETHMILALVSVLFAAFVFLQLGYLFGGSEVIVSTSGLTVAEHARRGFFELLFVAALTLALLFAMSLTDCERHVLRRYGMVLIVCVLIILASSLQRLFLYTDAFGMTLDRFSALAAILWLVVNLLSFAATVLRGDIAGFASGIAISAISCLLLLGVVNPAAVVTRINLDRSLDQNRELDVGYLLQLGADPLPLMLERFEELEARDQCAVALHIVESYPTVMDGSSTSTTGEDWRRWNAGRFAAGSAVLEHVPQIEAAAARAAPTRDAALGEVLTQGRFPVMGVPIECQVL